MTLEKTIIDVAKIKLGMLRDCHKYPNPDENQQFCDFSAAHNQLSQLIEIAHMQDSGLTESGVTQLLEIESEMCSIIREMVGDGGTAEAPPKVTNLIVPG